MATFYFINWIVAAENIEGGKLFKGGNYSREETICGNTVYENFHIFHFQKRIVSAETIRGNKVCGSWKPEWTQISSDATNYNFWLMMVKRV